MLSAQEVDRVCERVLSDLPQALGTDERFRRLVEGIASEVADRAHGERLDRIEAALERLAAAQARTEERLERLEATVAQLAEAQARTEERVNRLEAAVERLTESVLALTNTVAGMKGTMLEINYRQKVGAYFGPLLRRVRVVEPQSLEDQLEARLSREEFVELLRLDLLVSGVPREAPASSEVYLAVEVSGVVDRTDVERASRRADALRRAGFVAVPAVAGEGVTAGAEAFAESQHVALVLDGVVRQWERALEAWAAS
ncbi:MAG: hypothetical protein CO096_09890 [Armatimonadetes bacterium CG_4_9_14_3_um_filter_66_14]|nr:MAG: hypothetical protein CO096_09890 [Armatimonadetes bacterium CG_4_9_14_3_um_filter_66_14]